MMMMIHFFYNFMVYNVAETCLQTENEVIDRLRSIIAEHYDIDESTVR
jgi:hypothetical protein